MDLKGAEVRNFYKITNKMAGGEEVISKVQVPHYQRPYKWDKNLVSQLIEDWRAENSKNQGDEYFAGSIVTVIHESNESTEHQLIDGQQRFTTIYLTNFLLFLLLRVALREAINRKHQLSIIKLLEELEKSILFSFQKPIKGFLNIDEIEDVFQDCGSESVDKLNKLLTKYCSEIYLPVLPESDPGFNDEYIALLKQCINNNKLRLSYDRNSYNKSIVDALSRVIVTCDSQHPLQVYIQNKDLNEGSIECVYLIAIKTIFDSFKDICKDSVQQDAFKASLYLIKLIGMFLSNVKLCVIQTGNQEDAYTLFEVLNDRSLALDDLDLIKNQFYKCLCVSTEKNGLSDQDLDDEISKREDQWGDRVFKNNSDTNKKLIAYLAISYITGSTEIGIKSHDNFRDKVKLYLNSYGSNYKKNDLETDFNIFETIKIFVDTFQMTANNRAGRALEAELSDKTITYKTVHLLLALGYEGVLAGLVNYILQYIKSTASHKVGFVFSGVHGVINDLANDSSSNVIVHEQAKRLWQLTLINKDFKKPKSIANQLIQNNNRKTNGLVDFQVSYNKVDIEDWLNPWRYGSNDLKVKILFLRLIQLGMQNGKLINTPVKHSISQTDVQKFHLDHMEPALPDVSRNNDYYKFGQADRIDEVNALGNMYPLYGDHNISKSNSPMRDAFGYLVKTGLNTHWLFAETKAIFDANNNNLVPTKDFFVIRKCFLIDKFYEAINL